MEYYGEENTSSAPKLQADRNPVKIILLSIFTLGIYQIIYYISVSFDINRIANRHDGKETLNYIYALILSFFTFSIVMLVWHHQLAKRIENELTRRNIDYDFGAGTYWGWGYFGSLILIGPFVYIYKLCHAMNLLCADYNITVEKEYAEAGKHSY